MDSFQMGDHVRICGKNINGEIIDAGPAQKDGTVLYIVEKDEPGYTDDPDAYRVCGWELYDCTAEQLTKI